MFCTYYIFFVYFIHNIHIDKYKYCVFNVKVSWLPDNTTLSSKALIFHRNQVKAGKTGQTATATWSVSCEDQQGMKTNRRKGRSPNMDAEDCLEEDKSYVKPAWWETAVFRFLNAVMVIFFLTAVVKLQSDIPRSRHPLHHCGGQAPTLR